MTSLVHVLVSVMVIAKCQSLDNDAPDSRAIVGGYEAPNRPFYVRIFQHTYGDMYNSCGGVVIAANLVMTAAHCVG